MEFKQYKDSRGWKYYVRSGIGRRAFKTFYRKPGKTERTKGSRMTEWKETKEEAQMDLDALAMKKGWVVI